MTGQGPVAGPSAGPVQPDGSGLDPARRRVVDLGLAVDRDAPVPLPDQLERELRARLGGGELRPGDALPSSRALAGDLAVSRGVVVEAYDRLIRQGLLVARQGAAVRVSAALRLVDAAPPWIDPAQAVSWATGRPWRLRLHPAATPIGTLDRRAWGAALRAALRDGSESDITALDGVGVPGLRLALAQQLSRSRGVVTDPAHLAITSGVTDAIRGLAPILAARGGRVAVEEPGFVLHRATLLGCGLEVVPIPVDQGGLRVEALDRLEDLVAMLLTPAHQMPLGVPLAPDRRAALVRWARDRDVVLLEDDYDGELRYDRRGVRSLHALAPDRVVYLGSTSKVLSHAVRIGWMVTPPELTPDAHGWRLTMGSSPSSIDQLALAELLRTGAFDRSVGRLRRRCAAQREALLQALAVEAPELQPTGVTAGLHVALRVRGVSSAALVTAAAERDIELFVADDDPDSIMLAAFGPVDVTAAPRVAAELAVVARAARAPAR